MQKFPEQCGFNPFHCKVNHYDVRCPRSKYKKVIENLLLVEELAGGIVPPYHCTAP